MYKFQLKSKYEDKANQFAISGIFHLSNLRFIEPIEPFEKSLGFKPQWNCWVILWILKCSQWFLRKSGSSHRKKWTVSTFYFDQSSRVAFWKQKNVDSDNDWGNFTGSVGVIKLWMLKTINAKCISGWTRQQAFQCKKRYRRNCCLWTFWRQTAVASDLGRSV